MELIDKIGNQASAVYNFESRNDVMLEMFKLVWAQKLKSIPTRRGAGVVELAALEKR